MAGAAALLVAGCAGPGGGAGGATAPGGVWETLLEARPEPLAGAPRVSVSEVLLLGAGRWAGADAGIAPGVAVQELVSLGLLRRRDVHFVERRRFARASELDRRGEPRPEGAPPIGRSPGAELLLTGTWARAGPDSAYLNLRLDDVGSGEVVRSWRTPTLTDADLPSLARAAVGGCLRALDALGLRPAWDDPRTTGSRDPAPGAYRPAGVSAAAVEAFLRGLAAEDRYEWEEARVGYQRAAELGGDAFFEPDVALARAARLRAGGSLGRSER